MNVSSIIKALFVAICHCATIEDWSVSNVGEASHRWDCARISCRGSLAAPHQTNLVRVESSVMRVEQTAYPAAINTLCWCSQFLSSLPCNHNIFMLVGVKHLFQVKCGVIPSSLTSIPSNSNLITGTNASSTACKLKLKLYNLGSKPHKLYKFHISPNFKKVVNLLLSKVNRWFRIPADPWLQAVLWEFLETNWRNRCD